MKDILDYSLLAHNTFGIDARCHRFLEFATVEEAQQVADILKQICLSSSSVRAATSCSPATTKA